MWGKQIIVDAEGNAKEIELGSRVVWQPFMTSTPVQHMRRDVCADDEHGGPVSVLAVRCCRDGRTRPEHLLLRNMVFRCDEFSGRRITRRTAGAAAVASGPVCGPHERAGVTGQLWCVIHNTREVEAGTDESTGEIFRTSQPRLTTVG